MRLKSLATEKLAITPDGHVCNRETKLQEWLNVIQFPPVGAIVMLLATPLAPAAQTHLYVQPDSTVTIDGNNNLHSWKAQTTEAHGWIEFPAGFPDKTFPLGELPARMEGSIRVGSLHISEGPGFDQVMYRLLREHQNPLLYYRLLHLSLKRVSERNDQPYLFDSQVEMIVAGVTNRISMPLQILPLRDHKLRITGRAPSKLSAFRITPFEFPLVDPADSKVTYQDDIGVSFELLVGPKDSTRLVW